MSKSNGADELFCQHGNLKESCAKCDSTRNSKQREYEPEMDCPVWKLSNERCDNEGCLKIKTTPRQFTFQCSTCGWEWRQWKQSERAKVNTLPKIVNCVVCKDEVVMPISRNSDSTCSKCGRDYFIENHPRFVRADSGLLPYGSGRL